MAIAILVAPEEASSADSNQRPATQKFERYVGKPAKNRCGKGQELIGSRKKLIGVTAKSRKRMVGCCSYDTPEARRDALERHRGELRRIRLELAKLNRTGSREGLAELSSEAGKLSMRIKRFEANLRADWDLSFCRAATGTMGRNSTGYQNNRLRRHVNTKAHGRW